MGHDHCHDHHHHHDADGNLLTAFVINLVFTILEIGGGFWTNSVAILADAVHDAGDCLSIGMAWYLNRMSQTKADAKFTYGYRRLSSLGALVTGLVLMLGLGFVGWRAIQRLTHPEPVYAPGVIGMAVLGLAFNGFAVWRMRKGKSLVEQLVSWHLLEDTLGWGAVLLGGISMYLFDIPWIDPALSLMISLFVLWNVFQSLRRVALIFLQAAPPGFDLNGVERQIAALPGCLGTHHTNTWTLDGQSHVFSTHLILPAGSTREQIVAAKRHVHELLRQAHFVHITVEVELEGEDCADQFVSTNSPPDEQERQQTELPVET